MAGHFFREAVAAYRERDPAARSFIEVLLCYPGLHALALHRVTHALWRAGARLPARFLAYLARWLTGIEIHPAARIGRRMVIDHGMGVVIGETAEVGDDVYIYHQVTLGGTSSQQGKRHPTLGNGVIVGAGAKVLGAITVGDGARVGANAVVVADVPAGTTVVGIPARPVDREHRRSSPDFVPYGTPCDELLDPLVRNVEALRAELLALEAQVARLQTNAHPAAAAVAATSPRSVEEQCETCGGDAAGRQQRREL